MKFPLLAALMILLLGQMLHAGAASQSSGSPTDKGKARGFVGPLGDREKLVFEGNQTFTADLINSCLRLRIDFQIAAHPDAPLPAYLSTLQDMVRLGYLRGGFPDVKVAASADPDNVRVVVTIHEGPRYKTGRVRFQGAKVIQDTTVQQRLLDALAGFLRGTDGVQNTNVINALWVEGGYAPFDEEAALDLKQAIIDELESLNYYRPGLELLIEPNRATQQADLVINLLDEGLRGTVEEFHFNYPLGEKKNTDQELLDYLGLKPGMPFRAALLGELEARLWDSGRFYQHEVKLVPLLQSGKFRLDFQLEDTEAAAPLRQGATTNETAFLNLCRRLNEFDQHADDLVLKCEADVSQVGRFSADLVLSRSGLALNVRSAESNSPARLAYALVLSESIWGCYSGWREAKLVAPGEGSLEAFVTILPDPSSEGGYRLSVGAGMSTTKRPEQPIHWRIKLAPSNFLRSAHDDQANYALRDGVLHVSDESDMPVEMQIEVDTGRLLRCDSVIKSNGIQVAGSLRFEEGGFARVLSEIANSTSAYQNAYLPDYPASSWLGFVLTDMLESGLLESSFVSNRIAEGSSPKEGFAFLQTCRDLRDCLTRVKARLGKKDLTECFIPLEQKLQSFYPKGNNDETEDGFLVPLPRAIEQSQTRNLLSASGAWLVDISDTAWPRDSWPWILTRETGFTLAGETKYTPVVLERLLANDRVGPLGTWAAAALLAKINAPLAEKFVVRSLDQLSAEGFQQDVALLLSPDRAAGQVLGSALKLFGQMQDPDLDALAKLLGLQSNNILVDIAQSLRTATNQAPAEALRGTLQRNFKPVIEPELKSQFDTLLSKVGTPKSPAGAYQRAAFILQTAKQPEDFAAAGKLLLYAAEAGYAKAQVQLGRLYQAGEGVPQDDSAAMKWFLEAARQDEPHAGCRVADLYFEGRGVPRDEAAALHWYERDATNGCVRSQFRAGQCREKQANLGEALLWYRLAATNGFPEAQYTLGERLSEGLSLPAEYPEAYLWYLMAAQGGSRLAAVSAKSIKSKLTPAQVDAAEAETARLIKRQKQSK